MTNHLSPCRQEQLMIVTHYPISLIKSDTSRGTTNKEDHSEGKTSKYDRNDFESEK